MQRTNIPLSPETYDYRYEKNHAEYRTAKQTHYDHLEPKLYHSLRSSMTRLTILTSPPDTYGPTHASFSHVLTMASPGSCEATFSPICRIERHIYPQQRHLPHAVRSS